MLLVFCLRSLLQLPKLHFYLAGDYDIFEYGNSAKTKGNEMKNVKVTINQLLGARMTLENAQNRGNIPTNHAISKNLSRVMAAIDPFFKAQKEEPLCWHFWEQIDQDGDPDAAVHCDKQPTEEQLKEGLDAFNEYLALEVDFEPYRLQLSRCSDELGPLSKARESLSEDDLAIINENFTIVLRDLEILTDEV